MKKIIALLMLTFALLVPAAAHAETWSTPTMDGTIGKYKVVMKLTFNSYNNNVTGWYYYKSQGAKKKIQLKGTLRGGTLKMTETVNGKVTGRFNCDYSMVGNRAFCYNVYGTFVNYKGQDFYVDIEGCD